MPVSVRTATQQDIDRVSQILELSTRATQRLLHERTTKVAETDGETVGALAYDVWNGAVHITHIGGTDPAITALLEPPTHAAANLDGVVEILLPTEDTGVLTTLEAAGFEDAGAGPAFHGGETRRYRRRASDR